MHVICLSSDDFLFFVLDVLAQKLAAGVQPLDPLLHLFDALVREKCIALLVASISHLLRFVQPFPQDPLFVANRAIYFRLLQPPFPPF